MFYRDHLVSEIENGILDPNYAIKAHEGDVKIIKNGMKTVVFLSDNFRNRLKQPWENSVVVKLWGKPLGYRMLSTKINSLWCSRVTPRSLFDCSTVDTRIPLLGRRTILNSCLGSFSKDASSVIPPAYPRGYWVAVEINLLKPLVSKLHLDGFTHKVEYEGLPQVCFECGRVGHAETLCPTKRVVDNNNCFPHMLGY
ncbi:conserved hypothetical protein [Ricinus communis]|uniref:CCHC-type domain-containing protein n=1 Tax=Ricinus communis TaxID=3988 RepID=B9T4W9_RICCO|nr:conserved hypothetical protein [Ricinus communis]